MTISQLLFPTLYGKSGIFTRSPLLESGLKPVLFRFSSLLVLYEGMHKDSLSTTDRLRHLSKRDSFGEEELEDYEDLTKPPTKEDLVTVKIIDFAHATFEGFLDDPIVHEGPDAGFLKGLDTLTDILSTALTGS